MRKKKMAKRTPKRRMRFNPTGFVLGSVIAKNRGVRRKRSDLPEEQSDLAVSFYDMAADYPRESFEMIAKRVVLRDLENPKRARAIRTKREGISIWPDRRICQPRILTFCFLKTTQPGRRSSDCTE